MNQNLVGAIIALLLVAVTGYAGYTIGKHDSVVYTKVNPIITANCIEPVPPSNKSFGATTSQYIATVTQYRKCIAACTAVAEEKK